MSHKRAIAVAGIAILASLALIENATRSVQTVHANVISVASVVQDKGPDLWRVKFELSDRHEYVADLMSIRPTLTLGDPVCVRMHKRSWAETKFQITADTSCWDGAQTPLRAPD